MHRVILAFVLAAFAATAYASPPTTCGLGGDYERALCAYQHRSFADAAAGFRAIVEKNEDDAHIVKSLYFLGRTDMKLGRFDEAATLFVRIYSEAPGFYREWNVDFLLGECRRAVGKD